jgi:hypothetical protein
MQGPRSPHGSYLMTTRANARFAAFRRMSARSIAPLPVDGVVTVSDRQRLFSEDPDL